MLSDPKTEAVNLFRKGLYVYLLFNFIQLLPVITELYGEGSGIIPYKYTRFSAEMLVNLLSLPSLQNCYCLFFAVQLLACISGFIGFIPRISAVLIWYTTLNLDNRIYLMNTGGEQLLNILLFYLMFVSPSNKRTTELTNCFDNTFIAACKIQVILVYALSALYKLLQPEWLNGSALFYVFNMDEFTVAFLQKVSENKVLVVIMTYFALAYQVLFPLLVFIKRIKKPLLICGIILHTGIALSAGLLNFSLIMICCYFLFVNEEWAVKWNSKLSFDYIRLT